MQRLTPPHPASLTVSETKRSQASLPRKWVATLWPQQLVPVLKNRLLDLAGQLEK
jgi:hypothetical protein